MFRASAVLSLLLFVWANSYGTTTNADHAAVTFTTETSGPSFIADTFIFSDASGAPAVLHVVLEFTNDLLQFRAVDEGFEAEYEVVVEVLGDGGRRAAGKIERNNLLTTKFDETNSRQHVNRHQFCFSLPAGVYNVYLELVDHETSRHVADIKTVLVPEKDAEIALSDVVFLNKRTYNDFGILLNEPNLARIWREAGSEFAAAIDVYSATADSAWLNYRIYDQTGNRLLIRDETLYFDSLRAQKLIPLKQLIWWPGNYVMMIEVRAEGKKVSARKSFRIEHWQPSPLFVKRERSRYMLAALHYVATSAEREAFASASEDNLDSRIQAFWRGRDPRPETGVNELQEVFQNRVDYTVRNFSNFLLAQNGPETERGRIYILYGPPNERRQVRASQREYEIWYYKQLDKRFIFVDKSGDGNFKLVHQE